MSEEPRDTGNWAKPTSTLTVTESRAKNVPTFTDRNTATWVLAG